MYFEIQFNRIDIFENRIEKEGNGCNRLPSSEEIAPLNEAQVSLPPICCFALFHWILKIPFPSVPLCYRLDFPQGWT